MVQCVLITSKNVYFLNIACTHFLFFIFGSPHQQISKIKTNKKGGKFETPFFFICALCFPESDGRFISIFLSFIKHLSLSENPVKFLKIYNFFILDPILDPKTDLESSSKIDSSHVTFSLIENVLKQR